MINATNQEISPLEIPPGFIQFSEIADPLIVHAGPIYERFNTAGERIGAFIVEDYHLDQTNGLVAHEGMLLLVADLFLGITARKAAGQRVVTLGLNVSRLGVAHLADLVEIRPRVDSITDSIIFASATLSTDNKVIMTVTSHWKILGSR